MKKINLRSILLIILGTLILCITGCDNNQIFSGSKTSNDHQFFVDFDIMNSTINSEMFLSEGDTVEANINIKKGDVDIKVINENDTVAYQGNDMETCTVMIEIAETGIYTFYVMGSKAEGSVYCIKSQPIS